MDAAQYSAAIKALGLSQKGPPGFFAWRFRHRNVTPKEKAQCRSASLCCYQ
jgi:hypothetical protein